MLGGDRLDVAGADAVGGRGGRRLRDDDLRGRRLVGLRRARARPPGSLITVPATAGPAGSRPFMAAIASTDTPRLAASPDSVSPARTM